MGMWDVEYTGTSFQTAAELINLSGAETGVPRKN